ncbi:MAG TPA: DUF2934 domain-containing protein [Phycisphaerae bacterium]|nr:DUF2934 domain-containing protein [Phycisphaerae bacterium]
MPPKKTSKPAAASTPASAPAAPAAPAPQRSEVKGSGTMAKPAAPREITYQQIELRAYEIYAGRGYAPGDPNADWLEAERQLKAGL